MACHVRNGVTYSTLVPRQGRVRMLLAELLKLRAEAWEDGG